MSEWERIDNVRFVRPRGDNTIARSVAAGDRALEVLCHGDPRRRTAKGVLVATVADGALWADGRAWPRASYGAGLVVVPECRCGHHHKLDLAKVWDAEDQRRDWPRKARRVDVRTVAAA